jgi:hypothetical protein
MNTRGKSTREPVRSTGTPNQPGRPSGQSTLVDVKEAGGIAMDRSLLDVRGWGVKGPDGDNLGNVDRIMLDSVEKKPRYLSVKHADRKGRLLLPVGVGTPDPSRKELKVDSLEPETVRSIPVLAGDVVSDDFERHVFSAVTGRTAQTLAAREWYEDPVFDPEKLLMPKKDQPTS